MERGAHFSTRNSVAVLGPEQVIERRGTTINSICFSAAQDDPNHSRAARSWARLLSVRPSVALTAAIRRSSIAAAQREI
ncbi:hypothetical protein CKO45_30990 [Paracraurococcus ruber]|uniref:Uncharacterized protein n=1 Tax=Paracraurococcus ruber TaxID=77675 RepID=A0ABS1D7Y8_9PROT|nr:hypothetical protein [Paracraurococcus ruber]